MVVDDRTGSGDLMPLLRRRGCDAALGRMEYGDIAFVGNGPEGCPMSVGIEVKKVADALKCITDGRFAGHQLPGLVNGYNYPYLLIEGRYRPDMHSGLLQISGNKGYWHDAVIGNRKFMYRDFVNWLTTIDLRAGCRVLRCYDRHETAEVIANLYHWWTDKEFDEHRSHLAFNESANDGRPRLVTPSLVRRVAKELPGVGWEKSAHVAARFTSVLDLAVAGEEEWRDIPGIGKTMAGRITAAIGGTK